MGYRLTNLNDHLAQHWASQQQKNILLFIGIILLNTLVASGLIWLNSQKFAEILPLTSEISAQKSQLSQQQSQIERLKNQTYLSQESLTATEIADFIQILTAIPTQSTGLEIVQISREDNFLMQLTFIGKYAKQQDFEKFQQALRQFSAFTINIDYLQSSEKYKAEFSLRLIPIQQNQKE